MLNPRHRHLIFVHMNQNPPLQLLQLLLARLERISVDSYWAHRASGLRGALLRELEQIEKGFAVSEYPLRELMEQAFLILSISAKEKRKASKLRNATSSQERASSPVG